TDHHHAADYHAEGKLSAATQIQDNTGVVSDNNTGIENAIKKKTDEQRRKYQLGKAIAAGTQPIPEDLLPKGEKQPTPLEISKAFAYYEQTHAALEAAGGPAEVARWEGMIAGKDSAGTLID